MTMPRTVLPGVTGLTVQWPTPPGLLLGLDSFRAWPSGVRFLFVLAARVRALPDGGAHVADHGLMAEWHAPGTPPPECVRFSVTYADATTISNLDGHGANPRGVLDLCERVDPEDAGATGCAATSAGGFRRSRHPVTSSSPSSGRSPASLAPKRGSTPTCCARPRPTRVRSRRSRADERRASGRRAGGLGWRPRRRHPASSMDHRRGLVPAVLDGGVL